MSMVRNEDYGPESYSFMQVKLLEKIGQVKEIIKEVLAASYDHFLISYPKKSFHNYSIHDELFGGHHGLKVLQFGIKTFSLEPKDISLLDTIDANGLHQLIQKKLQDCHTHCERLELRINENISKVLVTGDLNSGKSTFINALLRDNLLATDQQPCTSAYCEVIDYSKNNHVEEVHAIHNLELYDPSDMNTFTKLTIEKMQDHSSDDTCPYFWFKVYQRLPENKEGHRSVIHNGIFDISLIDSPGLNHDSLQTMSLFAKQEDIDVVIFVINAANHLTLSASEFLEAVAREKDYVFIVVNRMDDIKNQEKCHRMILQQIHQLLPKTFENSEDLIHFISAKEYINRLNANPSLQHDHYIQTFNQLEESLRIFTLEKRAKSKLMPARTFIYNVLSDLYILSFYNVNVCEPQLSNICADMEVFGPVLEKLNKTKYKFEEALDCCLDDCCQSILFKSQHCFNNFVNTFETQLYFLEWRGIMHLWWHIDQAVDTVNKFANVKIKENQKNSKENSILCIEQLNKVAFSYLPEVFTSKYQSDANEYEFDIPNANISFSKLQLLDFSNEIKNFGSWLGMFSSIGAVCFAWIKWTGDYSHITWYFASNRLFSRNFLLCTGLLIRISISVASDFHGILTAKICTKLREEMIRKDWPNNQAKAVASQCRQLLKSSVRGLQSTYRTALTDHENAYREKETLKRQLLEKCNYFKILRRRLEPIMKDLEKMQL